VIPIENTLDEPKYGHFIKVIFKPGLTVSLFFCLLLFCCLILPFLYSFKLVDIVPTKYNSEGIDSTTVRRF